MDVEVLASTLLLVSMAAIAGPVADIRQDDMHGLVRLATS